ncbi:MAG TPA: hypothetical protein VFA39_05895 [Steroidobacteraceae bacterium]|nr:hypothetical protein [Steroidobacteraceae bacterium]
MTACTICRPTGVDDCMHDLQIHRRRRLAPDLNRNAQGGSMVA